MLNRRLSFVSVAATFIWAVGTAHALTIKPFTAAELDSAQKAGSSVALHFHADWCPTCRAQDKALETLKNDPTLKNVTLLQADYDQEKALKKALNIRTQSTFVVFKGKTEVARSAGITEADKIKATLATGL